MVTTALSKFRRLIGRTPRERSADTPKRQRGALTAPALVVTATLVVVLLGPTTASAEFLGTLAQNILSAAGTWAKALLVLGGLYVGAKAVMGSHETGKSATSYIIGAIFLIIAGAGGEQAFETMKSLVGSLK